MATVTKDILNYVHNSDIRITPNLYAKNEINLNT